MAEPAAYTDLLQAVRRRPPRVAFILGSGLGDLDERLRDARQAPFLDVPGLAATSVPGHRGCLLLGDWAGVPVLVFSGRLHGYEGHAERRVVAPVQIARDFGVETLVATNAAGGIRADLVPGTLMALTDHLQWARPFWWRQPGPCPPCPPCDSPYDAALTDRLQAAAGSLGLDMPRGVYAQVTGPCYETQAEIRALRHCGADAVGMSTAREVQAGRALGMRCVGVSCITNRAAGLGNGPIHHSEVLEVTRKLRERLARLLETFLSAID
jgi:purine-nucleoside phosphorylase